MWTYFQATGELKDAAGAVVAEGDSGRGPGRNNPEMEHVHEVGPIPCGEYQIGALHNTEQHGPAVMGLAQRSGEAFGRSGFLIHGDNARA